jgi:hypothetical protein
MLAKTNNYSIHGVLSTRKCLDLAAEFLFLYEKVVDFF